MSGVEKVEQLDDEHLRWHAKIAGVEREWDSTIVRQEPDQVIVGRLRRPGQRRHGGVPSDGGHEDRRHRHDGAGENAAHALGIVSGRVEGDLERFKRYIEERGAVTGAWRGRIEGGQASRRRAG